MLAHLKNNFSGQFPPSWGSRITLFLQFHLIQGESLFFFSHFICFLLYYFLFIFLITFHLFSSSLLDYFSTQGLQSFMFLMFFSSSQNMYCHHALDQSLWLFYFIHFLYLYSLHMYFCHATRNPLYFSKTCYQIDQLDLPLKVFWK